MNLSLSTSPEISIPFLYEVWNWVGDTSILPTKWYELLKKHDSFNQTNTFEGVTRGVLIAQYVRDPKFDPNGFFFLTTRSEVVGGVLVWPLDESVCELVGLASLPAHREKETLKAIVALALQYAINKGFSRVVYNEKE